MQSVYVYACCRTIVPGRPKPTQNSCFNSDFGDLCGDSWTYKALHEIEALTAVALTLTGRPKGPKDDELEGPRGSRETGVGARGEHFPSV